jgi:hypothetical protein
MIPTWMIKDLERQRRERARQDPPQLRIELPVPPEAERSRPPAYPSPIVIQLG